MSSSNELLKEEMKHSDASNRLHFHYGIEYVINDVQDKMRDS